MKNIMKYLAQLMWLLSGILALILLVVAIPGVIDAKATIKDMRDIWSQVTIEDMRHALKVVEKELDAQILDLMIEKQRGDSPLEWTPENWEAFLDFCGRTGYVVSDDNWQRYISGQLSYK